MTEVLGELKAMLEEAEGLGGRVAIFEAAHEVAGRVLEYINGRKPAPEEQVGGAVVVLLTVAGEVLEHMHLTRGWPFGHVLADLERAREALFAVGPGPGRRKS